MVMTPSQIADFKPTDEVDRDWSAKPALYTDLNSPVVTGSTAVFPIVDGNSIRMLSKNRAGANVTAYLGYDSDNDALPDVEASRSIPPRPL